MLITKTNPTGVDSQIQKLQTDIHKKLMTRWGLDMNDSTQNALYECYGRCYRNKKDTGYVAELFLGGKDYKDAYWNDNLYALSFFSEDSRVVAEKGQAKVNVAIIFFVNLEKLKPSIAHRADEEVRQDVILSIGTFNNSFHYEGFETGIENVLREYPGSRRDEGLKAVDMQPIHSFRINLSLIYKNNNC